MNPQLREIDIHITDVCNGNCPMCYYTSENMPRKHGDLETLKKIIHNAIANGEVERYVFVGGDPCEHPQLLELLKYVKEQGKEYGVDTTTFVLSNTHDYKDNGKPVPMEEVAKYVDELDVTIHGTTAEEHDAFNRTPGSYDKVMKNLREFARIKGKDQSVGITINVLPHTYNRIGSIIESFTRDLGSRPASIVVQRIAPSGKAEENPEKYFLENLDVNLTMEALKQARDAGISVELCDVFPYCSVKEEYRDMFPLGGCNWGTEVCAVYYEGNVRRCAMGKNDLSRNFLELDTKEKFRDFWENDPELRAWRERYHLDEHCRACKMIQECGGACTMARKEGDPYMGKPTNPDKGHDYLCDNNCGGHHGCYGQHQGEDR